MIALLSEHKLVIFQTLPSCAGIVNAGDAHSKALHGSRILISTIQLSSFLKVCEWHEEQGKRSDVLA